MIATVIRHFVLDAGLSIFFDKVKENLFSGVHKPTLIGVYVWVETKTGDYVCDGIITSETENRLWIHDEQEDMMVDVSLDDENLMFIYEEDQVSDKDLASWLYNSKEEGK